MASDFIAILSHLIDEHLLVMEAALPIHGVRIVHEVA